MTQLQGEQYSIIREAKAYINAAFNCPATNMRRFHLLLRWAKELLQPLAQEGVVEAQWLLFSMPAKKERGMSDEEFDRRYMEQARIFAKAGNAGAQFFLACELFNGVDTRHESSELYLAAAQQGHTHAKWCYGLNLLYGHGVEKNEVLGLKYIEEAANDKFEWAIEFLSRAYASGTYGFPKDEALAAAWLAKLTESGVTYVMRD